MSVPKPTRAREGLIVFLVLCFIAYLTIAFVALDPMWVRPLTWDRGDRTAFVTAILGIGLISFLVAL